MGTPLRESMRNSSKWTWIGCIQPPEVFQMVHCSALFFLHAEMHHVGAVGERLAVHHPLSSSRSKRNERLMRGSGRDGSA